MEGHQFELDDTIEETVESIMEPENFDEIQWNEDLEVVPEVDETGFYEIREREGYYPEVKPENYLPELGADDYNPEASGERCLPVPMAEDYHSDMGAEDYHPAMGAEAYLPQMGGEDYYPQMGVEDYYPKMGAEDCHPEMGVEDCHPEMGAEGCHPEMGAEEGCHPEMGAEEVCHPEIGAEGCHMPANAACLYPELGGQNFYPEVDPAGCHPGLRLDNVYPEVDPAGCHPGLRIPQYVPEVKPEITHPVGPSFVRARKLRHLRVALEKDCRAVDMRISLFVAACQSYRFDSVLRPFPPAFLKDGEKDIELLLRVVEEIPPVSLLLQQVQEPQLPLVSDHVIDLLYWALISLRAPYLKTVDKECFDSVLKRVPSEAPFMRPHYIFHLARCQKSTSEMKWKNLVREEKTFYAYHGTKLENYHSIMHYGLQQHMSRKSLFGKGIYLTSELSVSFPYSPQGFAWGASKCGSVLSCVALCEVIDDDDYVKCQRSTDNRQIQSQRSQEVPGSIGGAVPNKYYVVTNSEMVRVRYLLVYSHPPAAYLQKESFLGWLSKHKFIAIFIGYGIFLSIIGIANSMQGIYLYELILKKIEAIYPILQALMK